jgi:endonuclease I
MKTRLFLATFLLSIYSLAQIPPNYYTTATGTGYTLKTQLYNKIKGHINRGYTGLWTTYATSDRDNQYENDNTIFDLYSENPTGPDPVTFVYKTNRCGTYTDEGFCYNREHIVPQSIFDLASPMNSDAHFIPPVDGYVNNMRSDNPHGNVAVAIWTSRNGSKSGTSAVPGYTGTVFEPLNDFKGDIARMYFYFATRYENTVATYTTYPMFNGTNNQVFTTDFLTMLVSWHNQDPVSAREIARNNAIYARQNNRNPFIDHPEYVGLIWGAAVPDTQAPTVPMNLVASTITTITLQLNWTASTDNIGVTEYEVYKDGVLLTTVATASAFITELTPSTLYSFYVKAKDVAGNSSPQSFSINATTAPVNLVTDLYFSEYIEGSANNKALEITNKTGVSVNLSSYVVKKQTNGSGAWSVGVTLSGTLANGAKFIMAHSSIASSCYLAATANYSSIGSELTFNGNDAIGLFKNGVLIDIIGIFDGGTASFSVDETLRRNTTIAVPKAIFNKALDWMVFPIDTCDGLITE